jgi:hypothetical protein
VSLLAGEMKVFAYEAKRNAIHIETQLSLPFCQELCKTADGWSSASPRRLIKMVVAGGLN